MERKKQSMWKTFALAFCLLLSLETGGCVRQEKKSSEQHELEIKVVTEEAIPEELMSLIEKNKKNPFRLTFADQGKLYLAEGYGEQKTTGYSVESGPALRNTGSSPYPYRSSRTGKRRRKKGDCNLSIM